MSTENGYQGWSNYETWSAALWLDNDQGSYNYWREQAEQALTDAIEDKPYYLTVREAAYQSMADMLKQEHEYLAEQWMPDQASFFSDIFNQALGQVDWREIASHHVDEVPLYSAGWNMPGYMPDSDPALFTDKEQAVAYIMESLEQYVDGMEDSEQEQIFEPVEMESELDKTGSISFGQYVYWVQEV